MLPKLNCSKSAAGPLRLGTLFGLDNNLKQKHHYLIARQQLNNASLKELLESGKLEEFKQDQPINEASLEHSRKSIDSETSKEQNGNENELTVKNIFDKINLNSKIVAKIGPDYDKAGKIIPRSIIGKPEWFLRNNQLNKLMNQEINNRPRVNSKQYSDNLSSKSKIKLINQGKSSKQEIKLTRQQCETQIIEIKRRLIENAQVEKFQLLQIPIDVKLKLTSQDRAIKKYNSYQQLWMNQVDKISNKVNKNYEDTMIAQSEEYRNKKETREFFEDRQLDRDKQCEKVWFTTLRQYDGRRSQNRPRNLTVLNDLPEAFNNQHYPPFKKEVEIIKKPSLTNLLKKLEERESKESTINSQKRNRIYSYRSQMQNQRDMEKNEDMSSISFNQTKFSKERIFQDKMKKLENQLNEYKDLVSNKIDYDNLAVVGKSQFEKEVDMIHRDQQSHSVYVKQNDQYKFRDEMILEHFGSKKDLNDFKKLEAAIEQNVNEQFQNLPSRSQKSRNRQRGLSENPDKFENESNI
eukprot:TRINITY_DN7980_c0_g1_i2.p1 TRINITY_DN7980_c0_g1~~TRINITY_DN7980_c0_g1_i2.p1  ORF type:complete len:521 (+),score=100.57 TRINITY_DN7980_c0_g1_i2:261-1823(+)